MQDGQALIKDYLALRNRQQFNPALLDYGKLDQHKRVLAQIAAVNNSAISVFDMYKAEHVFASDSFGSLLGYDTAQLEASGNSDYFDSRIHPEDYPVIMEMGVYALRFLFDQPLPARADYKFISAYRVLGRDDRWIRIVEQHQALEIDAEGNVWLTMSIVDVSPQQDTSRPVECAAINFRTGELVDADRLMGRERHAGAVLSQREREVLTLIERGHLSKEISELLSISVHTVNTHRQRILQKLEVDNSMEAVLAARRLGLFS